jgi:hypothetical protein
MLKKFSDFRDFSKSSGRLPKNIAPAENRKSAPPWIREKAFLATAENDINTGFDNLCSDLLVIITVSGAGNEASGAGLDDATGVHETRPHATPDRFVHEAALLAIRRHRSRGGFPIRAERSGWDLDAVGMGGRPAV